MLQHAFPVPLGVLEKIEHVYVEHKDENDVATNAADYFFCNLCFGKDLFSSENNEIDSAKVYYDLIAEENYKADYKPNVTGMIVGGSLTGVGMFLLGTGIYAFSSMPNEPGSVNDAAGGFLGTFCVLGSIPFLGVGIPVLSYNIYQYSVRKKTCM